MAPMRTRIRRIKSMVPRPMAGSLGRGGPEAPSRSCQWLATSARSAPANQVDDEQQDDCADQRDKESRQAEIALVERTAADQRRNEPSAQQGADDADDDIQEEPLLRVGLHDEAGYPSDNPAHDQPDDQVH